MDPALQGHLQAADLFKLLVYAPLTKGLLWFSDHLGQSNMPLETRFTMRDGGRSATFCKTNINILKFCMVKCFNRCPGESSHLRLHVFSPNVKRENTVSHILFQPRQTNVINQGVIRFFLSLCLLAAPGLERPPKPSDKIIIMVMREGMSGFAKRSRV